MQFFFFFLLFGVLLHIHLGVADINIVRFNDSSLMNIIGSTHYIACSADEATRLPGVEQILSKDSALTNQISQYDYPNPRHMTNINAARSLFEQTYQQKIVLNTTLATFLKRQAELQNKLQLGNDDDNEGQVWLLLKMANSDVARLQSQYQALMALDKQMFLNQTSEYRAIYPTNDHEPPYTNCKTRLRLNPAAATSAGAGWYVNRQRVIKGFNTTFTFQTSAKNMICTKQIELKSPQQLGTVRVEQYNDCIDGGSDGFAFVIQTSGNQAIGTTGSGLGYSNINDSIAIEFDMYSNMELNDPNGMHVALHVSGKNTPNSAGDATRLGYYSYLAETGRNLKDGLPHQVLITYEPTLRFNPFQQPEWKASPYIRNFLSLGIGTLRVFIDDMTTAVLNFPLSIPSAITFNNTDTAWVGFTSSTGSSWQMHDIIDWKFTEFP